MNIGRLRSGQDKSHLHVVLERYYIVFFSQVGVRQTIPKVDRIIQMLIANDITDIDLLRSRQLLQTALGTKR